LVIKKDFDTKVPYDYSIANVVTPYYNDTKLELNSGVVDFTFNPIDTLKTGDISSTRYALSFGEGKFVAGKNDTKLHFDNLIRHL